jgi:hypothetical protein
MPTIKLRKAFHDKIVELNKCLKSKKLEEFDSTTLKPKVEKSLADFTSIGNSSKGSLEILNSESPRSESANLVDKNFQIMKAMP